MLTNQEFVLALFHPNHTPILNFWNRFTSSIEHVEVMELFLTESFIIDDVYLSRTLDPNTPNGMIRDCCICDNIKIANEKDHLKHDNLESVINQKCCTSQNQQSGTFHNKLMKP